MMVRDRKVHLPSVRLVSDIRGKQRSVLIKLGLLRCSVLVPNCNEKPYAEVLYLPKDGLRGLFCKQHAQEECYKNGFQLPTETPA